MIQHVIGDDRVKRLIFEWNGLRVDLLELEGASRDDQVSPRGIQHPRRKIAEGDTPSGGIRSTFSFHK
jgi:hypothetical protein